MHKSLLRQKGWASPENVSEATLLWVYGVCMMRSRYNIIFYRPWFYGNRVTVYVKEEHEWRCFSLLVSPSWYSMSGDVK